MEYGASCEDVARVCHAHPVSIHHNSVYVIWLFLDRYVFCQLHIFFWFYLVTTTTSFSDICFVFKCREIPYVICKFLWIVGEVLVGFVSDVTNDWLSVPWCKAATDKLITQAACRHDWLLVVWLSGNALASINVVALR